MEKFYEDLYVSKTTVFQVVFDGFTRDEESPKLDNEEKENLEGPFTLEECKKSVRKFRRQ